VTTRDHRALTPEAVKKLNEKWDCGTVNKSRFAVIKGVPVADIGIAGYLLLAGLAIGKRWRLLAAAAVPAFAFSLYLAHIEKDILEVWCIYCVISLGIITLITFLSLIALVMDWRRGGQSRESTA